MPHLTPEQVDALLPQTQCGLCGYGGCMPYAEAIAFENAPIHLCPPGGINTLQALATLTQQDATPHLAEMQTKMKPPLVAIIREAECIGCTKCIQACPVDAIIGTAKQMHTILATECTGCELCVPPCPVDCIDLQPTAAFLSEEDEKAKRQLSRQRFNAKLQRATQENAVKKLLEEKASLLKKRNYIAAALARAEQKKTK